MSAKWYDFLSAEEAAEIEVLEAMIAASKLAIARRRVIERRAQSRRQTSSRKPRHYQPEPTDKDRSDAKALIARIRIGDKIRLENHPDPEMNGEYVVTKNLHEPPK